MTFTGWIYNSRVCPWIKTFDISISQNSRFSQCPFDAIVEDLVKCDLDGFVKDAFCFHEDDKAYRFLDSMFSVCGANLKSCYNDKAQVKLDGRNIFSEIYRDDLGIEPNLTYKDEGASAQVTVVDSKYLFFNMSSYSFWQPIVDEIRAKFNTINLGGDLLKIGFNKAVDNHLKAII